MCAIWVLSAQVSREHTQSTKGKERTLVWEDGLGNPKGFA